MLIRTVLSLFLVTMFFGTAEAQKTPKDYFNQGANLFLHNEGDKALSTVEEGIATFPNDEKLKKLRELLLNQQQKPQNQNSQNQDKDQDQDKDNKNKSGDEEKDQENPKGGENNEKDESNQDQTQPDLKQIPQQEVDKILNAIKNDEKELQNLLIRQKKQKEVKVEKDW